MSNSAVPEVATPPEARRITIKRKNAEGQETTAAVTLEELREVIADQLFTGKISVSKSEKHQLRGQFTPNDYWMMMELDMQGLSEFLREQTPGMSPEDKRAVKALAGNVVIGRVHNSFDACERVIRERVAKDVEKLREGGQA